MFPDIVPVNILDQKKLEIGASYLVAPVKTANRYVATNMLVGKFDGLNSLFEYQNAKQATAKHNKSSDDTGSSRFTAFRSYREATETFLHNPASIVDFKQHDTEIQGGESSGKELLYDVTGDMLDVGRFLSGEPEVFGSLTNGNPRNKRVNIIVHVGFTANVDQSYINQRGARVVRLVDWLESQNIRTQVTGVYNAGCSHVEIVTKQFDEPLNINDIAILGHSDFARRCMFRFTEYSARFTSGYGASTYFRERYQAQDWENELNNEFTVYVNGGINWEPVDEEFDALESQLTELLANDEPGKVLKVL